MEVDGIKGLRGFDRLSPNGFSDAAPSFVPNHDR
jgi:hypothetical protein